MPTDPTLPGRRGDGPPLPSLTALIAALEEAGLRGHGGASFPTATKLAAVAAQRRRPAVVVNASESEPLSHKDRMLTVGRPDAILDGAHVVAAALGADTIVVAVDVRSGRSRESLEAAIAARTALNARGLSTWVDGVAPGFVSGQETALISGLNGRAPKPTTTPPYPFEKGLRGRPTFVSNAETFVQIGRVARGEFDGTRLVTVAGAVGRASVVRADADLTVSGAVNAAGGLSEEARGILLGGYGGTWARAPEALGLALEEGSLRARGLTLGAGIIYVLGASACPVAEVAGVTRWMAGQSAGQCGPCVFGLDAIAGALEDLTMGGDRSGAFAQVQRWCGLVRGRGGCAHPDGVARFVTTALEVFGPDFADHAAHGACDRCRRPRVLPTPAGGGFGRAEAATPVLAARIGPTPGAREKVPA